MALRLALSDLIRATLPQGFGQVGFIGFSPGGDDYHVLAPLDLTRAQALCALGGQGQAGFLGGRLGWVYHLCRTYKPPPPTAEGPAPGEAFQAARRRRALQSGQELAAWARQRGWWLEVVSF